MAFAERLLDNSQIVETAPIEYAGSTPTLNANRPSNDTQVKVRNHQMMILFKPQIGTLFVMHIQKAMEASPVPIMPHHHVPGQGIVRVHLPKVQKRSAARERGLLSRVPS